MNILKHWKLTPVVGEIYNTIARIIYQPIDNNIITLKINNNYFNSLNNNYYIHDLENNEHMKVIKYDENVNEYILEVSKLGPSTVDIDFGKAGTYEVNWLVNGYLSFTHNVIISNEPDKIVFVSCDMLEANLSTKNTMWLEVESLINGKDNVILCHLGDQAYMDGVFKHCVKYVKKHNFKNKKKFNDQEVSKYVINKFGERYCETWMPHRYVLSNVSNYNIWDDHEITNNTPLYEENLSDEEKYVRALATEAYIMYQEGQHFNMNRVLTNHSWLKLFGDSAILAVERTSCNVPNVEILNLIYDLPKFIKKLVICFSGAPIPSPIGRYGNLYRKLIDKECSKFWNKDDLEYFYRGLIRWLKGDKYRDLLVVGGDLHFGIHGVVSHEEYSFPVVISSPITNQPTTDRWLASKGLKGTQQISDGKHINDNGNPILFTTISTKARRCFAVANLSSSPITVNMHYSTHKLPHSSISYLKTLISFK